ncbi:single-stranded DNA-binding protein [Mucilaginibacter sp. E4BP6]|uniref:single-stranded DNA-binding protein n=1 Tax=Mucilaginibacter sp. E4BP6 TaxID=2723089 RepID=UPI0015CD7EB6|nr:single-stranded DNA-binding protein [Mucilaginibacter sp. E4BP6]NYE65295.1 single-strand DNA-binding protein [Mucilaginibacter sp. E4BP6]
MEITGRLVADATVRAVNGDKNVTSFRIAINRSYTSRGEKKEETTYVDCGYWRTDALAPYLTKGLLVQLYGHMTARPWVNSDGEPMASLNFHTNEITLLSKSAKNDGGKQQGKPGQAGNKNKAIKPSQSFN